MSLQLKKTTDTLSHPIFSHEFEDIPGGVAIMAADLPTTLTMLAKGTPLGLGDPKAYHVCKTAVVYADSSDTSIKVKKNHTFVADDYISNGGASYKISSITTTVSAYDTLIVSTAMEVTTGMVLYLSTSAGTEAEDIAIKYSPVGLLRANIDTTDAVADSINLVGSVLVRCTVKESLLPYSLTDAMKTALTARIRFA